MENETGTLQNLVYVAENQYVNSGYINDYLREKCNNLFTIAFCKKDLKSSKLPYVILSYYRNGKLYKERKVTSILFIVFSSVRILHPFVYLMNFFVILCQVIKYRILIKEKISFFSTGAMFSVSGLVLRLFRIVGRTVFYVVDYKGRETSGSVLTKKFSVWIGLCASFCLRFCDVTAVINDKISKKMNISKKVSVIPLGTSMTDEPLNRRRKNANVRICYCGVIENKLFGLELIPRLLEKRKDLYFDIIGSGNGLEKLKKQISSERVIFYGFISESERNSVLLCGDIGWAINTSFTAQFSDPSKIKDYLSFKLPVLANTSQAVAPTLQKYGVGEVIDKITVNNILSAVDKIIMNQNEYRKGIRKYNCDFEYHKLLDRLFYQ